MIRPSARVGLLVLAAACAPKSPDPLAEATLLQGDIRRAVVAAKSLGRFGLWAPLEEGLAGAPCRVPLSDANRVCEVSVVGRGTVRLTTADDALEASGRLRRGAIVSVEYEADCANLPLDFQSIDRALQRQPQEPGSRRTVWENRLLRVAHDRAPARGGERCSMRVEAAPALLARIAGAGDRLP